MLKPSNPAARLHNILLLMGSSNPQDTIANAWRRAFLAPELPVHSLVSKIALVYSLPTSINNKLRKLDIYDSEMMFWWEELSLMSQYALTDAWANAASHVTEKTIAALRGRSKLLNKYSVEPTVDDDAIGQTRASVESIVEAVQAAEGLDDDLKQRILQQTDFITDLLDNVDILGGMSIKQEIDEALVEIVHQTEEVEKSDNPAGKTIKDKVAEIVFWLAAFNTGETTYDHTQSVLKALMPPAQVHQLTDGREAPQLPGTPKALPPSEPSEEAEAESS